jgi:hypothetical protein
MTTNNPRTCGQCALFQPYRDPETKRIRPSEWGRCGWRTNIKWPVVYENSKFRFPFELSLHPVHRVGRFTQAGKCECYIPKS